MSVQHAPDSRNSQRARILALLIRARGGWVPLREILALGIAQYNSRLFEARRMGFHIENRTERHGEQRCSWFRLVLGPTEPAGMACSVESNPEQQAPFTQQRLFPDDAPPRHVDLG